MKSENKILKFLKGIGIAVALPVAVLIIMEILIGLFAEGHVVSSMLDFKNMVRGAGISAAIAFALSMNLTSGRMDLSLGSQRVAATIVGGVVATKLGLGGAWVLLFAVIFGIIFGGIVGILYVTLRIPPMVLGIGVACIYECIGFGLTDGVGLRLVGTKGIDVLSNVNFTIAVVAVIVICMLVFMTYTQFSYKFRAVRGSQQIAKNAGINVFVNVAICYTVAGLLVAISGVLDASFAGSMTASMGLTSNGSVMQNMFPMMIGCSFLSRYINQSIGVISAAVAVKIMGMGLTCFNMSDATSGVVNMAIFIAFLVYQANAYKIAQAKLDKKRIAEAKAYKVANGLT
ncbi:MAG: ABC transporter permease [Lachnospira sp.]|nr:ABC transporter permease [Lachnospira sp.]